MAAQRPDRKECQHSGAALNRRYAQWLPNLETGGLTPEQPAPASFGSRVQDLRNSLVGRGSDAALYPWMLAC